MFFFEKKNQKTFKFLVECLPQYRSKWMKSFCFFFFRKRRFFLPYPPALIRRIVPVVLCPCSSAIKATRPPAAWTMSAPTTWSMV